MSTRFEKKIIMPAGKMGRTTLMGLPREDINSVERWHKKEWRQFVSEVEAYKHRILDAARDTYLWHREKCVACKKVRSMRHTMRKFKSRYHQRGSIMIGANASNARVEGVNLDCTYTASTIPSLTDFCINPCTSRVLAKLDNDGDWYWSEGSTSFGTSKGTWVGDCAVADYDGQWNLVSGTTANYQVSGTDGVWQAMSTDLSIGQSVSFGVRNGSFNFKLRDGTTLTELFTDSFIMTAEADAKNQDNTMIISHSRRICFWKIPRTGSSNIEMVLRLRSNLDLTKDVVAETHFYPASANMDSVPDQADGTPGVRRAHITPQMALDLGLLTQAQFDLYDHYCMVRNPVDRFISTYHLTIPRYAFDITKIIAETIVPNTHSAVWRKQVEYLTTGNITALPFSDYANSANAIFDAFRCPRPDQLPNVSRSHMRYDTFVKESATDAQRQEIEAYYHEDMLLDFQC